MSWKDKNKHNNCLSFKIRIGYIILTILKFAEDNRKKNISIFFLTKEFINDNPRLWRNFNPTNSKKIKF